MKLLNMSNYEREIRDIVINKKEEFVYGVPDATLVFKGHNDINEEYCRINNIEVYNSYNYGGCIVSSAGDVLIGKFKYEGWQDGINFASKFLKWLQDKGLNVQLGGNDFLVDGIYKVASYSSINLGDRFIYTGVQIGINTNIENIKNICTKHMNKIPKGLADYGITTEEVLQIVEQIANELE